MNDFLKGIISNQQKAKLFKFTKFNQRVKLIKEIIAPLKEQRDKRYAHLECCEIKLSGCDIKKYILL